MCCVKGFSVISKSQTVKGQRDGSVVKSTGSLVEDSDCLPVPPQQFKVCNSSSGDLMPPSGV